MEAGDDLVSVKIALAGPDAGQTIKILMRYAANVLDDHAGALVLHTNGVALWRLEFFKPDDRITVQTQVCAAEASEPHAAEMWSKLLEDAHAVVLIGDDGGTRANVDRFFRGKGDKPLLADVGHERDLAGTVRDLIIDLIVDLTQRA